MSENQPTALQITTPNKAARAPMLIEIPMNTQTSPTSASKAAKRLAAYPSPRKAQTVDDINQRLQDAGERRDKITTAKNENNAKKMESAQQKLQEIENCKQVAAAASATKLTKAEINRENINSERVKKASEHVTHAKEVCASLKKAEQEDYKNKLDAIEISQRNATEKRDAIIGQKKQAAAEHVEQVHDKIAKMGKEDREKKAALDQKMKDAAARRNVAEVSKTIPRKVSAVVTERAKVVIEVDTTGELASKCNPKAKERFESQTNNEKNLSIECVEEKLKGATERREQHIAQRLSSPTHKKNAATFQQNREKIEHDKKENEMKVAKRVEEAEMKAKQINEDKAKKAAEHCDKVKQVMTSHQVSEADQIKTKQEQIKTKQEAADARHQAEIQRVKDSASTFNLKVGENAKVESTKLKEKKMNLVQKMKDVEARRRVVETYKASPAKLRAPGAASPKKAAQPPAPPNFE